MSVKKRQRARLAVLFLLLLLFPVILNYFSPVLSLSGAIQGIISGSLLVFLIIFASSFFFGRAGCGWFCPLSGLQDMCRPVIEKKAENKRNWIRFLIWVPWLAAIVFFLVLSNRPLALNVLFMSEHVVSVTEPVNYIVLYCVYALVLALAFVVGNRSFCHHVCWINPFMVIGRKIRNVFRWPSVRLKSEKSRCINCKSCNEVCPMGLNVNEGVQRKNLENSECILCGQCADVCPKNVIRFSFSSG